MYGSKNGQKRRALPYSRVPKLYVEGMLELYNHQFAPTIVKTGLCKNDNTKSSTEILMSRAFT